MAVAEQPITKDTSTPNSIPVNNPVTGELIGEVKIMGADDVRAAVEYSREAQRSWAALSLTERARLLRKWGELMWETQQETIRVIRGETGKNDTGAFAEVMFVDNNANYYSQIAPKLLKPQRRTPGFPMVQYAKVYYKPHGVVGMISPWNYPYALAMADAIPALIAGNTVVFKPSEITPYSVIHAVDMMHKAGIPDGVVQVVTGDGKTGSALVELVDYVCFTGSTAVGKKIAVQAAERLIPYSLELGGKDAMIVLRDADLELTASGVLLGGLENAGQMCISVERVYVEEAIYDRFVERVKYYAQNFNPGPGDGLDVHMGSMTSLRELERTERHVKDALDKGATLIHGGKRLPELGPLFYEPAILTDVNHTMDVMREETFGPIVPIMKVKNAEEALRYANDSEYGLSGSVWTKNLKRGEQIATQMDTGDIGVNRAAATANSPTMPWGGQKHSGTGRRGGPEGLMRFVTTQSVVVDKQIGVKPTLVLVDPFILRVLKTMRTLRRSLPFLNK